MRGWWLVVFRFLVSLVAIENGVEVLCGVTPSTEFECRLLLIFKTFVRSTTFSLTLKRLFS